MTSSQLGPRCALRGGTENQKLWVTTASFSDTPGRFERRRHRTRMSSMTMLSSRPGCPLRRCRTRGLQKELVGGMHNRHPELQITRYRTSLLHRQPHGVRQLRRPSIPRALRLRPPCPLIDVAIIPCTRLQGRVPVQGPLGGLTAGLSRCSAADLACSQVKLGGC